MVQLKILNTVQEDFQRTIGKVQNYNQQLRTLQQGIHEGKMIEQLNQLKSEISAIEDLLLPRIPTLKYISTQAEDAAISRMFGSIDTRFVAKIYIKIT